MALPLSSVLFATASTKRGTTRGAVSGIRESSRIAQARTPKTGSSRASSNAGTAAVASGPWFQRPTEAFRRTSSSGSLTARVSAATTSGPDRLPRALAPRDRTVGEESRSARSGLSQSLRLMIPGSQGKIPAETAIANVTSRRASGCCLSKSRKTTTKRQDSGHRKTGHSTAKKASQKGPSCGSPPAPTTKRVADTSERASAPSATTREPLITPTLSASTAKVVRTQLF